MCDSATTGCFFSRSSKENGRSVPDLTASPGRAPPGPMPSHQAQTLQQQQQQQQQQNMQGHHQQQHQHSQQQHHQQQQRQGNKEPVLLQGDFRKVSGISSEIFRQIEAVENDHDPSTAAALEVVERRGEMIVRILEPRCMGSRQAIEAGQKFLNKSDARHTVQLVEIVKRPGQTLGLYIREGNGADRSDGVFISRIALESAVYNSGCLRVGDEILAVNLVDVTRMSLDDVVIIMSIPRRLVLAIRQRRGNRGTNSPGPAQMSRPEQKPPPVVVIKRDLRDDDLDDSDRAPRSSRSSRERRTGDGREMTESRSRLGLGLNNYSPQSEQLDLYYGGPGGGGRGPGGGGPVETPSWGYKPPPPPSVITEQPKGMHGFQTSHSYYQNAGTLESLAEKVHAFYPSSTTTTNRRMSAGGAGGGGVAMSQSHQRFPRSGSDQHLPRVEYADYASLGRHGLLARSSLKSDLVGAAPIAGGTLGRYGRYDGGPGGGHQVTAASQRTSKYGPSPLGATASLQRRSRPALDYSSDTEATIGPRPSYYYYNHPAMAGPNSNNTIHGAGPRGSTQALGGGPEFAKFNSLPRERPGAAGGRLGGLRGPRGLVHDRLQDEADGNVSAPEYSLPIRRDIRDLRNRITASPSIFTSDEYRAWLRRAPSSSAICEQMRASRDLLNQQRAHRFSCSAENIHDVLKNTEHIYSSRTGLGGVGVGVGGTLDRHSMAAGGPRMSSLPVRSLSSQHIGGPSSIRSPSVRRMRQLLELTQGAHQGGGIGPGPGGIGLAGVPGSMVSALTGHQSPAPTPSTTLPRPHRQIDINPAEYTKYKLDKPVVDAVGISGMLWIHLLAGRGLRAMSETSTQPLQPQQPLIRDLYCVLECDRIHKARTVVRSGDLQFDWDESFELDLVCNKQLDVLVYSWDPQHRHKLCYRGALSLTTLLRQSPIHQLALKVEPRGTIYLRLRHTDPFQLFRRRGLPSLRGNVPALFGADLETVVTRESKGAPGCAPVPIILRRCVEEVERRGLDIIGLYRLCGSATKKRLLREAFERNSRAVELTPEHVPDINVITGVLKDYLRELPEPLFTKCLFQMTVDALGVCLPDDPEGNAKLMLSILDCLPRANRATLVFLLDHLSLVVSASERNKMSAQALATALGPPLMLHSASVGANEEIDHAQPIAVLKYLLQIWPQPHGGVSVGGVGGPTSGRRGEPVEPRGNKASALPAGKSQLQQPGALPLQSSAVPPAGSSISSSQRSSSSSNIHLSSRSNALASSTSHSNMVSSILNTQQQQQHQQQQQSQQQPQHPSSAALLSIQPRTAASNPSATSSTLGQHLLSATPSTLQYQSVVAQLAQSHRALQQAGQQPHPSEVSAGLVERVQSPHHATPSPSSSSTSSASGSGSGTDTIKRGASPASVKFKESSSGYSLKSDTQSRILSSGKQLYGSSSSNNTTPAATNGHGLNGQSSRDGPGSGSTASELLQQQTTTRASSLLFSAGTGDYRSSSSSIASSVASSIAGPSTAAAAAPSPGAGLYGKAPTTSATVSSAAAPVPLTSTLNITTFSLDEKNNLVVSPSPSSASESSYRSSSPASSIQRDKSPISLTGSERQGHQPSSSSPSALRRQEQFDRADSAPSGSATTAAASTTSTGSSSSSFMSSLRSQTLGSYQFPSATLKLTSQLSSGGDAQQQQQQQQQDDGSTSSLLRKLTSSLSRTIVSNTGTLPISLGREKLSELSSGLGVGSSAGGSGGGGPSSTSSTGFSSSSGIGSISSSISSTSNSASGSLRTMSTSLGAYSGSGSGGGGSVPDGSSVGHSGTAAVTSMNIYGTLPKNSSIYSSYGGSGGGGGGGSSSSTGSSALSGLLSGTTSAYGISERLRALTTGSSLTGAGSSDTGVSSHEQRVGSVGSGATSSSGDLDSSGYDYESSGFGSSASYSTSTIDRGMASSGASLGSSSVGGGALSSSYFSTGSGSSPFATSTTETAATATAPYRVQYASTNPFLPSFNPAAPGSTDGSNGNGSGRNGDEPFDMK